MIGLIMTILIVIYLFGMLIVNEVRDKKMQTKLYESLDKPESEIIRDDEITLLSNIEDWLRENNYKMYEENDTLKKISKKFEETILFQDYKNNSYLVLLSEINTRILFGVFHLEYDVDLYGLSHYTDYQFVGIIKINHKSSLNGRFKNIAKMVRAKNEKLNSFLKSNPIKFEIFKHKCFVKCSKNIVYNDLSLFIDLLKEIDNRQ